jgi:hypothetical protein
MIERHYVSNGERVVAWLERGAEGEARRYVHVDHLGSVDVITDQGGASMRTAARVSAQPSHRPRMALAIFQACP